MVDWYVVLAIFGAYVLGSQLGYARGWKTGRLEASQMMAEHLTKQTNFLQRIIFQGGTPEDFDGEPPFEELPCGCEQCQGPDLVEDDEDDPKKFMH